MAKTKQEVEFDHLQNAINDATGFEDLNLQTMSIPFLRILQDLSPQLKKTKPEYIPGAEAGNICNTVSGTLYDPPLQFVVAKFERYFIEWGESRGKFIAAHTPEVFDQSIAPTLVLNEKNKLISPTTKHTFTDTYMYYVVLPQHLKEGVFILPISSTGIKEAKKLNRNLMHTIIPGTNQRALPYFIIWDLDVVTMSNDQGEWFGPRFVFNTMVTKEQLMVISEERKALPAKKVDFAQLAAPEKDGDEEGGDVAY